MRTAILLLVAVLATGCGLGRDVRQSAEAASTRIAAQQSDVAEKERQYRAFVASPDYADYRVYAEREDWAKQFESARAKTNAAKASFDREVAPLLTQNRRRDAQRLQVQVLAIDMLLGEADRFAAMPMRRRGFISDVRARYRERVKEASESAARTKVLTANLSERARQAKTDFPLRQADIDKRTGALTVLETAMSLALLKVSTEAANADSAKFADMVVLDDNARIVSDNTSKLTEEAEDLTTQLAGLSKSYSKALADMKVGYLITVERWSWNEDDDYPSVHHFAYPPKEISGDLFDYFNTLPENLPYVARYTSGFFGGRTAVAGGVDASRWEALDVSPKEEWPSFSDDTAEFGFRLSADYFHKYLVTEDGKVTETDWERVDESTFEQHVGDLGMDIVSKPYGAFEDEKIVNATPAGLAFVGNPRYGEWRAGNGGMSFWAWYGAYRLFGDLLGTRGLPYSYRRDEWDSWSTGHRGKPYYGEDKDRKERYGTGGYVTGSSNRYANRIPDMRKVTVRHSTGPIGRGTSFPGGK